MKNAELNKLDKEYLLKKFNEYELKKYLNDTIEVETLKSLTEMDVDLIDRYVDWLLEIENHKIQMPEEKMKEVIKSIVEKHYKPKKRKRIAKLVQITSACTALVFSVQFVSAAVFNINLFENIYDGANYMFYYHILDDISPEWQTSTLLY